MITNLPDLDPIAAHQRKVIAERMSGKKKRCACGEFRPEALVARTNPIICTACQRRAQGMSIMDKHHVAGKANSPVTIQVDVNDHRAELNTRQYDWPKRTLENPDGSPLLRAAGCIRGIIDTLILLVKSLLGWIPRTLELLDAALVELAGVKWHTTAPFAGVWKEV